jgi:intracellular multiplication protein IcmL
VETNQSQRDKALKQALEVISTHYSTNDGDVILRENARLHKTSQALQKQLILVWSCVVVLCIALSSIAYYFINNYPKTKFIVTTNNKAICEVSSLDKPNVSSAAIESFAQEAVLELSRYDYTNFEEQINSSLNRFFTKNGKQAYYTSLDISGNLQKVKTNKMISRATILRSPQIQKESIRNGQYTWIVAVPISNEFYVGNNNLSNAAHAKQGYYAIVTIVQDQATALNAKGIAIDAIVLQPMQGNMYDNK